jgi:hypothetical protein
MCEISVCVFLPPSLLCFSLVPRSLPPSFSYRPLSTYSLQATALNEVCPHVSSSRIGGRAARGVSGEVFVRRQPSVSLSSKPERCVSGIANENPTDRKCRVRSLAGRFSGVSLACRGAVAGVPGDGTLYRRNIHNFCLVSDTAERSYYYIQGRGFACKDSQQNKTPLHVLRSTIYGEIQHEIQPVSGCAHQSLTQKPQLRTCLAFPIPTPRVQTPAETCVRPGP